MGFESPGLGAVVIFYLGGFSSSQEPPAFPSVPSKALENQASFDPRARWPLRERRREHRGTKEPLGTHNQVSGPVVIVTAAL
ncbi:hypothetical protein AV530_017756 [Patagioenas fasciata monilis]|uniref:Uncharacterized protein n=1 Tax=Patagioenas fasciata monilis TaxID=372326 RepID=A0A1V4KXJ7_PATFA|nr:hypothetical protein AV530_017756 [Patagioenas fasciata monilis]